MNKLELRIITKKTHGTVLRLAPPFIIISSDDIDFCVEQLYRRFDHQRLELSLAWRSQR